MLARSIITLVDVRRGSQDHVVKEDRDRIASANLVRMEATCHGSINNATCLCLPGFTGSQCQEKINQCDSNPCQNGGTCVGSIYNQSCLCPPGFTESKCQTIEPRELSNMQILIISALAIILVTLMIILPVIIYKRIYKTRKSNDAGLSSKHGTTIESASQHAEGEGCDEKDGVGSNGNQISCLESGAIYGQVVSSQNDDQRNTATSSSLVYADLEFSQQIMQVETYTDPAPRLNNPVLALVRWVTFTPW